MTAGAVLALGVAACAAPVVEPLAPPECDVTRLPLDTVAPLAWRPCTGSACDELAPPHAAAAGWGFGGVVSATVDRGAAVVAVGWARSAGTWESAVFRDGAAIAGWRSNLGAGCLASTAQLADGGAAAVILRAAAEREPWLIAGGLDELAAAPGHAFHAAHPSDRLSRAGAWTVVQGDGGATAITGDGRTLSLAGAADAVATRDAIVFVRGGALWSTDGRSERLVAGNVARVAARGDRLALLRPVGDAAHLEVAALARPAATRLLARVPPATTIAVAAGWIIARVAADDVRILRDDGGDARRLPADRGRYAGVAGIAIAGERLYALVAPPGVPPNDHRRLERWAIADLPF